MSDELKYELIDKVRSFPAIWDKNHDQHHNRYVLHQRWKKIAQQLGVKELNIKKVWRNLRQEFGKQVKRIQKSGREPLETANPPWPYYHSLLFLKEQFISTDNASNVTEQDQDVSDTYDDLQEDYNYEMDGMSDPMRSPSVLSETPPRRENGPYSGYKKTTASRDSMEMAFVEIERERLEMQRRQQLSETVRDEDVGFFNSLLPHVRQLQPQQKMMFRLRVQHQLYELLYGPYDPHQSLPYLSSNQGDPICTAVYSNS